MLCKSREKQRNVPQPLPLPLLVFDPVLAVLRKAAFFTTHVGTTKLYLYSFAQLFYINPQPNVNSESTAFMLEVLTALSERMKHIHMQLLMELNVE